MLATNSGDMPYRIPRIHSRQQPLPLPIPQHQIKPHYTISYLNASQPPHTCSTHPTSSMTRLSLPIPPPPPPVPTQPTPLSLNPLPNHPTLPTTTDTAPVDLYRKRKLAQRAQHIITTTHETTNKKLKPLSIATPLSPPRIKQSKANNPISSPQHRLAQRQKQLELGYTTPAYTLYTRCVTLTQRDDNRKEDGHPVTPRKEQVCSKRSWDGQVRKWRRQLHEWDAGGRMYTTYMGAAGGERRDSEGGEGMVDRSGNGSVLSEVSSVEEQVDDGAAADEECDEEDEDDWRESIVRMAGALPD